MAISRDQLIFFRHPIKSMKHDPGLLVLFRRRRIGGQGPSSAIEKPRLILGPLRPVIGRLYIIDRTTHYIPAGDIENIVGGLFGSTLSQTIDHKLTCGRRHIAFETIMLLGIISHSLGINQQTLLVILRGAHIQLVKVFSAITAQIKQRAVGQTLHITGSERRSLIQRLQPLKQHGT